MKNNQLEKLSDYADYSKAKISIAEIDTKCYFSTENMLPNKGGVTEAAGLPTQDNVTKVLPENVLVSNIRPYFKKIYFANELAGASNDVLCFVAKNGCLPRYLYYLLSSDSFFDYMMAGAKGTKMPRGDKGQIMNFPVWVPAQNEQSRIVSVLSALDEKIENISKINHNLEEQAKALYDQIWDNYDSGTWSSAKTEDLFDISIGKTPPRKESQWFSENDNDIVWVSIADMGQSGCFISNSSEYLTPDAVSRFNVKRVPAGAILLSFKLTVGRVAIAGCELTTNEAIAHFRMDDSSIREYLFFYLKQFNYQTMGSTSSIATAVNSKMVKAMRIDIPPKETLEMFHSTVSPMFGKIKQNQQETQKLTQLRDALLPKLMSGEIDVSEVEV